MWRRLTGNRAAPPRGKWLPRRLDAYLDTTTKLPLLDGVEERAGERRGFTKQIWLAQLKGPSPRPSPRASLREEGVNVGGGVKLRAASCPIMALAAARPRWSPQ